MKNIAPKELTKEDLKKLKQVLEGQLAELRGEPPTNPVVIDWSSVSTKKNFIARLKAWIPFNVFSK